MTRFLVVVLHVVTLCVLMQAQTRIDPALQQAIGFTQRFPGIQVQTVETYAAGERLPLSVGQSVGVIVKSSGDIRNAIETLGGTVGSRHGDITTAFVPLNAVNALAAIGTVEYVEASRPMFSTLDLSLAKTGADILQTQIDPSLQLTGKGVIVGLTDTGINTDHPNFKTLTGRTRILYVWDQFSSGTPPAGFSYGAEKDSAAINAGTWSMPDAGQHGTHTSGIAAGNGLPSRTYVGMAPEADIIMVANSGNDLFNRGQTTVGTLDGYDYIRTKANALGRRFVINTSQGTNMGPHDGRTLFEQAVNADVAAGNIVCISAGNEATSMRHASAIVTTSTAREFEYAIGGSVNYQIPLDIWYETNDRLQIEIKKSADISYRVPVVPGGSSSFSFDSVTVTITSILNSPLNNDNEIYLTVTLNAAIPNYAYRMKLRFSAYGGNTLPQGGRVDLWWERNYAVYFMNNVDQSITLGMPACADSAITVASYNNRAGYGSAEAISTFSGMGPRRDGVLKPDIAGLGGMVTSSIPGGYATMSGTSMSSPHVTGAVALLLQKYPALTSAQARSLLKSSAVADAYTGATPNSIWGAGKLNVLRALSYSGTFPRPPVMSSATLSGANGILTWADPTLNIDGTTLSGFQKVYVFRNGQLRDSVNPGVQTYTDPALPPGSHFYYLVAKTSGGRTSGKSNSMPIIVFEKSSPILVVDDDAGATYQTYFTNALAALGKTFDIWTSVLNGPVSSATLQQYVGQGSAVIWFTGNDYSTSTLDTVERAAIGTFLNAGGRLFISGQDIGFFAVNAGASIYSFYQTYLKATYVQDNVAVYGTRGAAGSIFDGVTFRITGGTGANNQTYPDEVNPLAPASSILFYDPSVISGVEGKLSNTSKVPTEFADGVIGSGTAGVQYTLGDRRVVYFPFGFEAIDTDEHRTLVMSRILDFLIPISLTWQTTMKVSDGCGGAGTLRFGQSPAATDGLDAPLGEEELPPVPPTGVFDARFMVPTAPPLPTLWDFRADTGKTITWRMVFQPGLCGYPITFKWGALPAGTFVLKDEVTGYLVRVNMKGDTSNTYTLTNPGITSLRIEYAPATCRDVVVDAGWNIISVPLVAPDMSVASLFPGAASAAYAYDNGYVTVSTLTAGSGYWLKFNAPDTYAVCGSIVPARNIPVKKGWNMIGPFEVDMPVGSITTTPAGMISSSFYGYTSGYVVATTLQTGNGYWVKDTSAGELHLPFGFPKRVTVIADARASWPAITLRDQAGRSATLYLGPRKDLSSRDELPPLPPAGVFDARFSGNSSTEACEDRGHTIVLSGPEYPVTIMAKNLGAGELLLKDPLGGKLLDVHLANGGSVIITQRLERILLESRGIGVEIPAQFELSQNYPNPFNPTTIIKFALPQDALVTLELYNMLGQKVQALVEGYLEAGYHSVELSAGSLASGTYLYRLKAGSFTSVRKLVVLK